MKKKSFLLIGILLISAFLRLYRLEDVAGFDFDQERVAISATKILTGDLTLIGQEASVGGVFVGPWYDYIIAVLLFISKGDPSIIFYTQALIGVTTTYLLYKIGEKYVRGAGILAAFFYALSARFILIDTNSTPTNGIVFLTALALWIATSQRFSYKIKLISIASITGFAAQMHPSGFAIIILVFLLLAQLKDKSRLRYSAISIGALLFWFLPLFVFDLRNEFLNLRGLLFSVRESVNYPLVFRLLIVTNTTIKSWLQIFLPTTHALSVVVGTLFLFVMTILVISKLFVEKPEYKLLLGVLFSSPLIFSIYGGHIPDYYVFPSMLAFLLLISILLLLIAETSQKLKFYSLVLVFFLFVINLRITLLSTNPFPLAAKKSVVQFIKQNSDKKIVNIQISADIGQNYGFSYLLKDWAKIDFNLTAKDPDFVIFVPQSRGSSGKVFADIRVVDTK